MSELRQRGENENAQASKYHTGLFSPHLNRWTDHATMLHKVINRKRMKDQYCSHNNKLRNQFNCGPINAKKHSLYILKRGWQLGCGGMFVAIHFKRAKKSIPA